MFTILRAVGGGDETMLSSICAASPVKLESKPLFDALAQAERWRRSGVKTSEAPCQDYDRACAQDWLVRAAELHMDAQDRPAPTVHYPDWATPTEVSSSATSSQPLTQIETSAGVRAALWLAEGLHGLLPWLISISTTSVACTASLGKLDIFGELTALVGYVDLVRVKMAPVCLPPQLARLLLEPMSIRASLPAALPSSGDAPARQLSVTPTRRGKRQRPTSPVPGSQLGANRARMTVDGGIDQCGMTDGRPSIANGGMQAHQTASPPPPAPLLTGNLKNSFTFPLHTADPTGRPRSPPPLWPRTSVTVIGDGDFDADPHAPPSTTCDAVAKEPMTAAATIAVGAATTPAGACVSGPTLCDFFAHTAPPFTTLGRGAKPQGESDEGRHKHGASRTSRLETGAARRSFFPAVPQTFTQAATSMARSGTAVPVTSDGFVTAGEQLVADVKAGRAGALASTLVSARSPALGLRRGAGFQPPFHNPPTGAEDAGGNGAVSSGSGTTTAAVDTAGLPVSKVLQNAAGRKAGAGGTTEERDGAPDPSEYPASLLLPDGTVPPLLQPLDPKLVTQVALEILEHGAGARHVGWEDIAGLQYAKRSIEEAIVWPLRRPDLFVGLRDPPRGLLLFGPPGTGKTMIARAIANRAQCTFLNISSSSIMSKWVGDGEKLVRCLFAVATVKQPSVVFVDEVDSLLSARGEGEMDAVRRVKTEFLVQLDGVATDRGDRVLLIGATNRPDELDEAARRRMEKRLYIPLPDEPARRELMQRLLRTLEQDSLQATTQQPTSTPDPSTATARSAVHTLTADDLAQLARLTDGYSGADLKQLCREAAMGPLREMTVRELSQVAVHELRPINLRDFKQALRRIRPSVGAAEVRRYEEWNAQFGSFTCNGANNDDDDDEHICDDGAPHSTTADNT